MNISKKPGKGIYLAKYHILLNTLKNRINSSRISAALSVNTELIKLYWEIGNHIYYLQKEKGWGAGVSEQLSIDLRKLFPDMRGFSKTNLDYMLRFAQIYTGLFSLQIAEAVGPKGRNAISQQAVGKLEPKAGNAISQQAVGKLEPKAGNAISQQAVGKLELLRNSIGRIPWGHNLILMERAESIDEKLWYAENCIRHGWSRNILKLQMDSGLYLRQKKVKKQTNFKNILPHEHSDLAEQAIKDPYIFDFLTIRNKANEKELEEKLTEQITRFLVELGAGFAFVGKQFKLSVGKDDFFIDLLFYHIRLKCYVVIELKTEKFKPEYAGKLNFYLTAVDSSLKLKDDNPTIGILLCPTKNTVVVEYALQGIKKPIGVSEYRLRKDIPLNLKNELSGIQDLKTELEAKLVKAKKQIQSR